MKRNENGDLVIKVDEIPKNCVIVIGDGKAKIKELPAYGELTVITHQQRVRRIKIEEGEEF